MLQCCVVKGWCFFPSRPQSFNVPLNRKEVYIPEERVERVKKLAQLPDIYERLAAALAPSIYENEDIKKGILLQLFGGTRKDFTATGHSNFRSEVNILLCGDPGIKGLTRRIILIAIGIQTWTKFPSSSTILRYFKVATAAVCLQAGSSIPVHFRKGIFRRRFDCLRHQRPRNEATLSADWCAGLSGQRSLLHRRV